MFFGFRRKIVSVERKGKFLAIHLDNQFTLLHHLGMSGRLILADSEAPVEPHTHIRILLDKRCRVTSARPQALWFLCRTPFAKSQGFSLMETVGTGSLQHFRAGTICVDKPAGKTGKEFPSGSAVHGWPG